MPYIKGDYEKSRLRIGAVALDAGQLNYQFTFFALEYLAEHGISYQSCNDIMGALEGAKQEFYRRVVAPYEDKKCKENGDVYPQ